MRLLPHLLFFYFFKTFHEFCIIYIPEDVEVVKLSPKVLVPTILIIMLFTVIGIVTDALSEDKPLDLSKDTAILLINSKAESPALRILFDGTIVGTPNWEDACHVIKTTGDSATTTNATETISYFTVMATIAAMAQQAGHPCKGYVSVTSNKELKHFNTVAGYEIETP